MLSLNRPFGVPAFVLGAQQALRQALEVYSGNQVRFDRLKVKTKRTENGGGENGSDLAWCIRHLEIEAEVAGFDSQESQIVNAEIELIRYENEKSWSIGKMFILNVKHIGEPATLAVGYKVFATSHEGLFPRVIVQKMSRGHTPFSVEGRSINERVM